MEQVGPSGLWHCCHRHYQLGKVQLGAVVRLPLTEPWFALCQASADVCGNPDAKLVEVDMHLAVHERVSRDELELAPPS